jgi:CHAD domain-containing protein
MLAHIAANAAVLREAPQAEAVHQLRVASRRLRSALAIFRPVVEDGAYEGVKAELKWLAKAFDQARNLDVFAEEVLGPAAEMDAPPAGLEALSATVVAARETARRKACETAGSERFRALMIDAVGWVETGDWLANEVGLEPARAFAGRTLDHRLKTLVKRSRKLASRDDAARHEVRITAKKLRYAAEGFAGLYPEKKVERFTERLKTVQDTLGQVNDVVTAGSLAAELELSPDAAFAAGDLAGLRAARKPKLIAKAARALDRLADARPFWN